MSLVRSVLAGLVLVVSPGVIRRCEAQSGAAGYRPDSAPPRRIVMPHAIDVPLVPEARGGSSPMVDVMVNGHGPYHFLIETGARSIGVARRIADSIGLPRIGGPDNDPEFHVDSITLGGGSFQDLPAEALPFDFPGIDGVLGLPAFQELLLTVDYGARRARFTRDTLPPANGTDILALSRVDDFWGLPITIAGKPFIAVLDTQNDGSVGLPPSVADSLPFDGGLRVVGRARGVFGVVDVRGGRLAGNIRIGAFTFPTPFLTVAQLPPDYPDRPNVGTEVLQNFVVSLDQVHGRLRLARTGDSTISLPERGRRAPPPH